MMPCKILCGSVLAVGLGVFAAAAPADDDTAAAAAARGEQQPAVAELSVSDFKLKDTTGKEHVLSEYVAAGKTVVLEWFNPDCPFVVAWHGTTPDRMAAVYERLKGEEVVWLAINSGAEGKQGAGLERNQKAVADWKLPYPVLLDMDGRVGKAYGAKTTPHMYIISQGALVYEGAIDDSGGRGEAKVNYVEQVLSELREGKAVSTANTKSYGCSVKYAD
jgi:peroxiredoxin